MGPAERGGVAVIVLGKAISIATAGDMGIAVKGVSGNCVVTYGVCALLFSPLLPGI